MRLLVSVYVVVDQAWQTSTWRVLSVRAPYVRVDTLSCASGIMYKP